MTDSQINQITIMRQQGASYSAIAKAMKLSQNTVKSYCLRHDIRNLSPGARKTYAIGDITQCENCGGEVEQYSLKRYKRFCCDACRNTWWNHHPNLITRKAVYEHTCKHCGRPFRAYGNARRKYCSHECYIADRFGGGSCE